MDDSIIKTNRPEIWRETQFRQPSPMERRLGLWVDRIGAGAGNSANPGRLRILGQYAAVAVESGRGKLRTISHGIRKLRQGDVIFLTPAEPACYYPEPAWFTRWVVWNGSEADALFKMHCLATREPVIRDAAAAVQRAGGELKRCMNGEDLSAAIERKVIILQMLLELRRGLQFREPARKPALVAVVEHIERNLDRPWNMAELARLARLSIPHFRRLFTAFTGRPPSVFIAAKRVGRAKTLLEQGASIKETAALVGYPDPAYFMRVFRRVTGETAGHFAAGGGRQNCGRA